MKYIGENMIDITKKQLLESKNFWFSKYTDYKNTFNTYKNQCDKYVTLRDRVVLSIQNAEELYDDTLNLIQVLASGIVVFGNKTYGEYELIQQSKNMTKVAEELQPIVDCCNKEISVLESKISDVQRKMNNAWYNYLDCCNRVSAATPTHFFEMR